MENKEVKVKLKPKQLASIQQIQAKKANLQSLFQDLNQQENVILELILEDTTIDGVVSGAKLEEDTLIVTVSPKKPAGKVKRLKAEEAQ